MNNKPSLLISFGGNALNVPDQVHYHQREEFEIARKSMQGVIALIEMGYDRMILTHGNGPQVGQIFLQQELTRDEFPRQITLDVCVADSQGRIGYLLQNVFDNLGKTKGLSKKAAAIITQVMVDSNDPAFERPTKPIGLYYDQPNAEKLMKERGWNMIEDAGRGFRRVVPSPKPLEIIEKDLFYDLLGQGFITIGGGGGGVPVTRSADGALSGVEAVIDKDHTSSLLATECDIDELIILTQIDHAYLNFNTEQSFPISNISSDKLEVYLNRGEFAEGSMKPKVEAALNFLKNGGKRAVIANLNDLIPAMEGKTGTQIL